MTFQTDTLSRANRAQRGAEADRAQRGAEEINLQVSLEDVLADVDQTRGEP